MSSREDIRILVRNLIRDNWTPGNTFGVTPYFTTGWYDEAYETPQISFTNPSDGPINGGMTGFSGITTQGIVQTILGTLQLNCWVTRAAAEAVGANPKQLTYEMACEVERIIDANPGVLADYFFLSFGGKTDAPDTEASPTVFRQMCEIGYGYIK